MSSSRKRTKPKDLDDKCAADSEPTIQPEPSLALRPTNTRVIQLLKRPRTVVNHSYIDYSLVPFKSEENELPNKIEDMDFHQKLHDILGQSSVRDFVCWLSHGRAFKVSNPAQFETVVCPAYFGHRRYSSFLHQLGIHGYKHLSRGPDRNAFYSQLCLRGLPHLKRFMPPPKKVFRRLKEDQDSEPDFATIQLIAPLPSDSRFGKPLTVEDIAQFCRENGRDERPIFAQLYGLLLNKDNGSLLHSISQTSWYRTT